MVRRRRERGADREPRVHCGEHPEPRLGDFREGIVMTRFFADLSLTKNGDGSLGPLARTE